VKSPTVLVVRSGYRGNVVVLRVAAFYEVTVVYFAAHMSSSILRLRFEPRNNAVSVNNVYRGT